jgi:hypothetical protein
MTLGIRRHRNTGFDPPVWWGTYLSLKAELTNPVSSIHAEVPDPVALQSPSRPLERNAEIGACAGSTTSPFSVKSRLPTF